MAPIKKIFPEVLKYFARFFSNFTHDFSFYGRSLSFREGFFVFFPIAKSCTLEVFSILFRATTWFFEGICWSKSTLTTKKIYCMYLIRVFFRTLSANTPSKTTKTQSSPTASNTKWNSLFKILIQHRNCVNFLDGDSFSWTLQSGTVCNVHPFAYIYTLMNVYMFTNPKLVTHTRAGRIACS